MSNIVYSLRDRIDATLGQLLSGTDNKEFMLADIPDHANVGDSAITLGEIAFFRRQHPDVKLRGFPMNLFDRKALPLLERADVIFLHGGGNFGDIWPKHHEIRLKIIEQFGHKKIIQFPQSISFESEVALQATQKLIAKTKNLTLLLRDLKSLAYAHQHFDCEALLCPDMAFSIGPIESRAPNLDYSCLLRTDKEVLEDKIALIRNYLQHSGQTFEINDWLKNSFSQKPNIALRRALRANLPNSLLIRHGLPLLESYAKGRVSYGVSLLGKGNNVITDRLHGYIISTLMGRNRFVFDSLDGKIRAFHDAWLSAEKTAVFLDSADQLQSVLERNRI